MVTLLLLVQTMMAKGQCGLYMSAGDFRKDKLSGDCNEGGVRTHDFFGNVARLTVQTKDGKKTFRKSDVYGFRNAAGEVYRLYENGTYRIEEAGDIFIYSQTRNIAKSKGYSLVKVYYFSVSAESEVMALNGYNLNNAYSSNEQLVELLRQYLNGSALSEYDSVHKMFRVNYAYSQAVKHGTHP